MVRLERYRASAKWRGSVCLSWYGLRIRGELVGRPLGLSVSIGQRAYLIAWDR